MPGVYARGEDEPVDKLLRILKKQVEKAGLMYDIRKKECFVKPSTAKVLKSRTARKRAAKDKAKRNSR
jgi:small subunit ribosomal protein S21